MNKAEQLESLDSLVTVLCTFRFSGGGDTEGSFSSSAGRLRADVEEEEEVGGAIGGRVPKG